VTIPDMLASKRDALYCRTYIMRRHFNLDFHASLRTRFRP
jgi:hypothetical protein